MCAFVHNALESATRSKSMGVCVCLCQLAARKQVGNAMKPYQKAALTCVMKKNVVFSLNQNDNTAAAAHECIFPNYRRKTEQFIRLTQIRCCCCWHPCNRDDASRNTRVAKARYPTACQPHTTPFLGGCDRAGFLLYCFVGCFFFFYYLFLQKVISLLWYYCVCRWLFIEIYLLNYIHSHTHTAHSRLCVISLGLCSCALENVRKMSYAN